MSAQDAQTSTGRGAEDDRWDVLEEEGIRCTRLRALVEALDKEFDEAHGGFPQFVAIKDPYRRAVVSDLIGRSAQGIADNLLEARLAQRALDELLDPDGRRLPTQATGREHIRESAWMDLHLGSMVSALQAGFDCLAATAIGVLRVPLPIKKAQISQLVELPARFTAPTPAVARAWDGWSDHVTYHQASPPTGWWAWLAGMRHQRVHRARQNRILIQRVREDNQPQVVLFADDPAAIAAETARFDSHLRRRPHLADMEDFVLAPDPCDLWLAEPAGVTLAGVFDAANEFCEDSALLLLSWWRYADKWRSCFPPPSRGAWAAATGPGDSFDGVAPPTAPFRPAAGMGHPSLARRLTLAQSLRAAGTLPGSRRP